jgi:hypothetical protein
MENILSLRAISLQQRSLIQYVVANRDVKGIAARAGVAIIVSSATERRHWPYYP